MIESRYKMCIDLKECSLSNTNTIFWTFSLELCWKSIILEEIDALGGELTRPTILRS